MIEKHQVVQLLALVQLLNPKCNFLGILFGRKIREMQLQMQILTIISFANFNISKLG
jgi:hypothetical protein